MKKIGFFIALVVLSISGNAQQDSTQSSITQVTFFYPLGTNGVNSADYVNNFSFNILYGLNGGLKGIEVGGLVNSNTGPVEGAQFAGIANVNTQTADGLIMAGIANVVADSSNSICAAGIANVIGSNYIGMQMAGITNIVNGNVLGAQTAGIANVSHGNFKGLQAAGIVNVNTGEFKGVQTAGISNVNKGDLYGAQLGLINRAQKVNGFQFGLINIANEFEGGVPLGLLSYVRNGYHAIELAGGDAIYGNLNLKLGVEKLYTIYKMGFATRGNNQYITYGFGLGSKVNLSEKFSLSLDGSANHIIPQNVNPKLEMLNKLDISMRYAVGNYIDFFIGPSINVYLSQHNLENETAALAIPYAPITYDWRNGEGQTYFWVGGNAGISVMF